MTAGATPAAAPAAFADAAGAGTWAVAGQQSGSGFVSL